MHVGGGIMLVKCCKPFSIQEYYERLGHSVTACPPGSGGLLVGEIYLVIEITIDSSAAPVTYRIMNDGYPVIYPSYCFEIVSGSLDGLGIEEIIDGSHIAINHNLILDSKLSTDYGGGFWEVYFGEDKEKEKKAINILKNVIKDLSSREKIPEPPLN
jgi:hypothetical protein